MEKHTREGFEQELEQKKQEMITQAHGEALEDNAQIDSLEKKIKKLEGLTNPPSEFPRVNALIEKLEEGEVLTKADLVFLYEPHNSSHLKEIRKGRNPEEDMLAIFECTKEQIARTIAEITEDTKAYVGQLEPGIFQKLPENIEHLYTSFPENRIMRSDIETGLKTAKQLIAEMEAAGINIHPNAKLVTENSKFVPNAFSEKVNLITITAGSLGLGSQINTSYEEVCEHAQALGLELCPHDTGHYYQLKYKDQPLTQREGDIAMRTITGDDDRHYFFSVRSSPFPLIEVDFTNHGYNYMGSSSRFIFRLRPESKVDLPTEETSADAP